MSFNEAVYKLVSRCPRGRVVSYGGVAAKLGKPRAARAVGAALRGLPDSSKVPWWRVINGRGEISIRGVQHDVLQKELLIREGVKFDKAGRVDWEKYGWNQ